MLNRRNALFYKALNGAGAGDLFMSLIHTCELNGANTFDHGVAKAGRGVESAPPSGCRGTTARHWHAWHDLLARNIRISSWAKRIDCGRSQVAV